MQHTVKELKLDNGARGLFIDVPSAKVVNFDVVFRAGDYLSPIGKMDTAHVMEHMVLGSNKRFPSAKDYNKEFTKFGAYNNAYTGDYHMGYEAECEAGETERIFDLLCVAIESPLFLADEFKSEVGNVREELKMRRNNDDSELSLQLEDAMGFIPQSWSQRIKELDSVTLQDIIDHYKKTHTSSNLTFVIVGPIAKYENSILTRLTNIGLEKGDGLIELPNEKPVGLDKVLIANNKNLDNICYRYEIVFDKQLPLEESDSLTALFKILFDGLHSRVFGSLREKGIAYGIFNGTYDTKNNSVATISGQVQKENIEEVFKILNTEINDIAKNGIKDNELTDLRKRAFGEAQLSHQTVTNISDWYRATYTLMGKIEKFSDFQNRLDALSQQSIQQAAKDIVNCKLRGIGIMHNPEQVIEAKKLEAVLLA